MVADSRGDERAIRKILRDYLKPFEVGDVEAMLDYYADDMIWMFPNSYSDATKSEAREFYGAAFQRGDFADNRIEIHELRVLGDWAFVRCTGKGKFIPKGEDDGPMRGSRHLYLFRKEKGGRWRIARDIFNNPDDD